MNKLKPKNKICFQNKNNPHAYTKIKKLTKKKWFFLKKKFNYKKEIKPEKKIKFFQKRLFEKQQLKNFYSCISEYKLKNLLNKKKKINTFKKIIIKLERRLDVNILRLKFTRTIFQAKQLISHKKIEVNNKIINKSNFLLKKGDIITIKHEKKNKKKKI